MQTDLCITCAHYLGDLACLAFPERIPNEILTGTNDHSKPLKNQDSDLIYEPR